VKEGPNFFMDLLKVAERILGKPVPVPPSVWGATIARAKGRAKPNVPAAAVPAGKGAKAGSKGAQPAATPKLGAKPVAGAKPAVAAVKPTAPVKPGVKPTVKAPKVVARVPAAPASRSRSARPPRGRTARDGKRATAGTSSKRFPDRAIGPPCFVTGVPQQTDNQSLGLGEQRRAGLTAGASMPPGTAPVWRN
jgi:hypothetical protein